VVTSWRVVDELDAATARQVDSLLERIQAREGEEPFSETQLERLTAGRNLRHVVRREPTDEVTGYGVLAEGERLEAEAAYGTFDRAFAEAVATLSKPTTLTLRDVGEGEVRELVARGWHVARTVLRLARPLPAPEPPATDLVIRPFNVGVDEATWVASNNAAFAGHPVQSTLTVERVQAKERAAWFDRDGFLMFWEQEALVASCWTKMRRVRERAVGEIYVIFVAPEAQGRGLGRLAVLAGLAYLASQGATSAELYVEGNNAPALGMYRSMGFDTDASVVELRRDVT
jgi:mycothiol synthase